MTYPTCRLRGIFFTKKKIKPRIVNQHSVVYCFKCDLRDSNYVGYTTRHLFQRVADHRYSAIGRHLRDAHGNIDLLLLIYSFFRCICTRFHYLLSLDNDVLETSKRRAMFYNILSQNFIVKCLKKNQ